MAAWLNLAISPAAAPLGVFRAAIQRRPSEARARAAQLDPAHGPLLAGLAALLAGEVREAWGLLAAAAGSSALPGPAAAAARLGLGVAGLLAGDAQAGLEVSRAAESAEAQGIGFLARLGHACQALRPGAGADHAAAARRTSERLGDGWGAAIAGLLEGWVGLYEGDGPTVRAAADLLGRVADWLRRMEAPVLEAWAAALRALALARAGDPEARPAARRAASLALACGVTGAGLFADAALAASDATRRSEHLGLVEARRASTGIAARWAPVEPLRPAVEIRLFGAFRLEVDGVPVDPSSLKPRARALLRLLAAQEGRPLHREVIQAALWPEATAESAARTLQVAISSLRQALEPGVARAGFTLLVRDGDAYCLASGPELRVDLRAFESEVTAGRRARAAGDAGRAMACLEAALDRYQGELLPEDGAADWAVELRERCRSLAAEAAEWLAELRIAAGDPAGAARAAAAGLRVERYHDRLWRLLAAAREEAGDPVAASRARAEYRRVLGELGLPTRDPREAGSAPAGTAYTSG